MTTYSLSKAENWRLHKIFRRQNPFSQEQPVASLIIGKITVFYEICSSSPAQCRILSRLEQKNKQWNMCETKKVMELVSNASWKEMIQDDKLASSTEWAWHFL